MLDLIHQNPFDTQLSVKTLRRQCGLRDHNVSSDFKFFVGCSIMAYVTSLRLMAAIACLQGTGGTITNISRRVGYISIQRFYVAFYREFGTTPGRFRGSTRGLVGAQ
jgi:AraC-like DNA-binding protein